MIKLCHIFGDGKVIAFDENDQQVTEVQGFILDVGRKLMEKCDQDTEWGFGGNLQGGAVKADLSWWWKTGRHKEALDADLDAREIGLKEMIALVLEAEAGLRKIEEHGTRICSQRGDYVTELFAYFDQVKEQKQRWFKILGIYKPIVDEAVDADLKERESA